MKLLRSAGCTRSRSTQFSEARATNLYLRTKDLLFVRDYLNHKDAKVTQTYIDYEAAYRARTELLVSHHNN